MQPEVGRREQLDSLRAFAIVPVLYTHFWNDDSWMGTAGVYLFFVLSGYLITGILIRSRGKPSALRTFYIRRALRIAPIYYCTLIAAWLVNLAGIRSSFPWHAAYLSNVWFALHNSWSPWYTAHLWSLSVEEQFYLFWPFLILSSSLRAVRAVVCIAIVASVGFQLGASWIGIHGLGQGVLIFASLDKLGAGALLALAEAGFGFPRLLKKAGWVAFIGILGLEALPIDHSSLWAEVLRTELSIVAFAALTSAASLGILGLPRLVLDCRAVRYVGRISYGIYLYHLFIYGVTVAVLARFGLPSLDRGPALFVLMSAISIGAAAVSWRFFEQPLNSLKERFAVSPA